jgi:hypothetical protein
MKTRPGLPDKKSCFVLILEVLAIEDVGLFLGNVVYVLLPF